MSKLIPLSRGQVAIVSDHDYDRVSQFKWCAHQDKLTGTWYARRMVRKPDGKYTPQSMHRFLLGLTDPKLQGDHVNGNGLDNRRENLRVATRTQNQANQRLRTTYMGRPKSSRYKGVCWYGKGQVWRAQIQYRYKLYSLGAFATEIAAALAYDDAAQYYFGEFARLNFPVRAAA